MCDLFPTSGNASGAVREVVRIHAQNPADTVIQEEGGCAQGLTPVFEASRQMEPMLTVVPGQKPDAKMAA